MSTQGITYNVDLRFVIDTTGSMAPYIDQVKARAIRLPEDLLEQMKKKDKGVDKLFVGVIAFGDYSYDGERSMRVSKLFEMPAQRAEYEAFVRELSLVHGGDEPESGGEALAFAMKSDWHLGGDKNRQVIVVLTDASAHDPGRAKGEANYPDWLPTSWDQLTDWWQGQSALMDRSSKRLLLFAPDGNGWSDIGTNWENTVHVHARAGAGLKDQDYERVLAAVAESV